ncbi:hypothetical protein T4E_12403 [Trichinella pseudospiralis]|uniref:Uncharacterized protein n=1 Tax=Trichinella pseudospiralis TaxID=6337 RepID=A0A0V0Y6T9_TRIPS|nr:hypothetical protein T4E_12403 [Trichinella pseudospiralis]
MAESVFPWLTCITKYVSACAPVDATVLYVVDENCFPLLQTNHISRRSKLNPSASRDDDMPAFHCQRCYEILYYEVEFVIGNKVFIWYAKERVVICLLTKHWDCRSFMHYVVTQILRYYHAVPNCASLGAHVLRFQTCLHQLPSLPSIQELCDRNCRMLRADCILNNKKAVT